MNGQFDEVVEGTKNSFGQEMNMTMRDSSRYIKIQNNYKYFQCRPDLNVISYDDTDHNKQPTAGPYDKKTYMNLQDQQSKLIKKSYRKIHQDAE